MLRLLAFCCCSFAMSLPAAQDLRLPFDGRWFVLQGGDTLNVNHHMSLQAQWFGVDFAKLGGPSRLELSPPNASRLEQFYSWGEPVLASHDGQVLAVINDLPDNVLGTKDAINPLGNYISIKVAQDRFLFLAHFQRGTITVKPGDRVKRGQPLGRCGNSGNSDHPHIHLHVQDRPTLNVGSGQNPVFGGMDVELNGKLFENVTWPVIRGLFIAPH